MSSFVSVYFYFALSFPFRLAQAQVCGQKLLRRAGLFCKGRKIGSKTGTKAALCFEELAANIINFGFPKCKRQPGLDLRLVFAKDEIVMRLRDNCPMFDVERYIAQEIDGTDESAELRLGLKLIGSFAENISYVHSLDNNNVIIRFPNQ